MAEPFPFECIPTGWYVVATSRELADGAVVSRRYFDQDLVLWREASGTAHVANAYCPHLGAHLGDGRVVGEHLQCPFHAFKFDGEGRCAVGYPGKKPPKSARLGMLHSCEQDGLVLAWYDSLGRAPEWHVPPLPGKRLCTPQHNDWTFRGHPQETSENSVDLGHFSVVHGYAGADSIYPHRVEGATMRTGYVIRRKLDFLAMPNRTLEAKLHVSVHGLGYSHVHAETDLLGSGWHLQVCSTPIDREMNHLRITLHIEEFAVPGVAAMLARATMLAFIHDVNQDMPLWQKKRHLVRPNLAEGDGPIAAYRRYCQQFYPRPEGVTDLRRAEN